MAWIKTIPLDMATGRLHDLYQRLMGPGGVIDPVLQVQSLRPTILEANTSIYKAILHHPDNEIEHWVRELIGVWVSVLNGCDFCIDRHFMAMKRYLRDAAKAEAILSGLTAGTLDATPLADDEKAALVYAQKLTLTPAAMTPDDVAVLRAAGHDDGAILEINQITAYFAYANRTVIGLGVEKAH